LGPDGDAAAVAAVAAVAVVVDGADGCGGAAFLEGKREDWPEREAGGFCCPAGSRVTARLRGSGESQNCRSVEPGS
jgi:hypothetical protein